MQTKTYKIECKMDELGLSVLVGVPESDHRIGIVQISHGMEEHKERYLPFMEYLCERGYVCVIHDHRGHGEVYFPGWITDIFMKTGKRQLLRMFIRLPVGSKKNIHLYRSICLGTVWAL